MDHSIVKVTDLNWTRSKSDKKCYRLLSFQSGFEALLVSSINRLEIGENIEISTQKAAAAMTIQTGSFADPSECEGLAHFLEHMVFMGSEKYPDENHYDAFINAHGGSCNAFTEGEYTTYQFDVTASYFMESVDIFANCFMFPIFAASSSDREIKAIENEFNLAKVDDGSRLQQLFCHFARDGHVLKKFSWGNKNSLQTIPAEHNVSVHPYLKEFHKLHYTPRNSRVVVLAPYALDELQEMIVQSFQPWLTTGSNDLPCYYINGHSVVDSDEQSVSVSVSVSPSKRLKICEEETATTHIDSLPGLLIKQKLLTLDEVCRPWRSVPPLDSSYLCHLTRAIPIESTHTLTMSWQLPPCQQSYRSSPEKYLGHLLGHEGEGSLFGTLMEDMFALQLSAGVPGSNFDSNSMFSIFWITVTLTEKGLANWITVVDNVFKYLNMLRITGPQKWIFDELKTAAEIKYAYLDEEDEEDIVEKLSIEMSPYMGRASEDLLRAEHLVWNWEPGDISDTLGRMTVHNCKIDLVSAAFRDGDDDGDDDNEEDDENSWYDSDGSSASEDNEDDDDDSDDDDTNDNHHDRIIISPDKLLELYDGPPRWRHLVLPPTLSNPGCSMCVLTNTSSSNVPCMLSSCSSCSKMKSNNYSDILRLEPFFGTKYWLDPLPNDLLSIWSRSNVDSRHHIPQRNVYIPTSTNLPLIDELQNENRVDGNCEIIVNHDNVSVDNIVNTKIQFKMPKLAMKINGMQLFHIVDTKFQLPKVEIFVKISSPVCVTSVTNAVMHDLLIMVIREHFTKTTYMASMAGLYLSIGGNEFSTSIRVSGINDKSMTLLQTVIREIFQSKMLYISSSIIQRQCEQLARFYSDDSLTSQQTARNSRLLTLQPFSYPATEKLASLHKIIGNSNKKQLLATETSLIAFASSMFAHMFIDALVVGNMNEAESILMLTQSALLDNGSTEMTALNVVQPNETAAKRKPSIRKSQPTHSHGKHKHTQKSATTNKRIAKDSCAVFNGLRETCVCLSSEAECKFPVTIIPVAGSGNIYYLLQIPPKAPTEKNVCVELYYQLGEFCVADAGMLDLLEQVLSEPYFDNLRTKQQLGYSLDCSVRQTDNMLGYCFNLTSSTHTLHDLHIAMQRFIDNVAGLIQGLSSEAFVGHVVSTINKKLAPLPSLTDCANNIWSHIEDRRYLFDETIQVANYLKSELLQGTPKMQNRLMEFSKKLFSSESRRLLAVHSGLVFKTAYVPDTNSDIAMLSVGGDVAVEPENNKAIDAKYSNSNNNVPSSSHQADADESSHSKQMEYDISAIRETVQGSPLIFSSPADVLRHISQHR